MRKATLTPATVVATGLTALSLGAAPAASPPAAAAASCPATTTVVDSDVKSSRLVIGTTTTRSVDLIAVVKDACRVARVDVTLRSPDSSGSFRADWLYTEGDYSYWEVVVDLTAADLANADAGTWTTSITAKGSTTASKAGPQVKVLRNAVVSLNATPEPVRRGAVITLAGKVERADWETRRYVGYPDRPIALQWRPAGGSTYTTLKSIKSTRGGAVKTTVHAGKDGCYRFDFGGSPVTGAASAADCVDVR